jgi:nucleotide-binding universal stress UspA family protein
MYKRILVATGGSPWSEAAVSYAIALAAHMGAELRILTVLTVHAAHALPDVMASSDLVMESIERQGQELLADAVAQAAHAEVPCDPVCKWGNVPETILHTVAEEDCDLIVLGSRMVSGRKRLILGSISNAVAAKAQQPILVVKRPPASPFDPMLWRRLLVATGGSPWSDAAVDYSIQLAKSQGCRVYILSVEPRRPRQNDDPDLALGTNRALTTAAARAKAADIAYETTLAYGDAVETIAETAAARQCDLVVLGSRGLTGWKRLMIGGTSNAVTVKTPLPVLIVKRFMTA